MNVQEVQFGENIFKFPTVKDPTTGDEYIPHASILGCLPDAHCFLFDGVVVPFMLTAAGALYKPKRVPHMPGKVLQVITIASGSSSNTNTNSNNQPPPYSADSHSPLRTTDVSSSQHQLLRVVKEVMGRHQSQGNDHLQQQIQQLSLQVSEIRGFSLLSLENQKKMLDQLALLQRKVEAILTQSYELHEYPIPRLFIILPVDSSKWDPRNKFRARFRLHFLCECGAHTKQLAHSHDRLPHHIHLALHEGYEVTKPGPFIENYGEYILGMLRMLKYGITVAGLAVPALSHLQVVRGLEGMEDNITKVSEQTILGIDQSISYLEARIQPHLQFEDNNEGRETRDIDTEAEDESNGRVTTAVDDGDRFNDLRALEGADLRRLQSFLKINDSTKVLGNLYRITTSEGHVKWVCLSHYRSLYREYAMKSLLDHIEASNNGMYDEHLQKISMTLTSSTTAAQFFDLLSRAPAVSELEIRLQWNYSGSDLARLRDVIRTSMVHSLLIDGCNSTPRSEVSLSGKRRNDRFLEIMAIDRIQGFRLQGISDFLSKLSISATKSLPLLHWIRLLHLFDVGNHNADDSSRLCTLLLQCPNLIDVNIEFKVASPITSFDNMIADAAPPWAFIDGDGNRSVETAIKLHSHLAMLEQLEVLALSNISLPTLSPTSRYPTRLRTLDLTIPTDRQQQEALIQLLKWNPSLVEFRLKSTSARMFTTDDLLYAIAACSRLERLECMISLWALNVRCKKPWEQLAALPSLKHVRFETTGSVDGVIQLAALVPVVDTIYIETLDDQRENLVVKVIIEDDDDDKDTADGDGEDDATLVPLKKKRSITIGDYRVVADLEKIRELMPMLTATSWTTLCIHGMFSHERDSKLEFTSLELGDLQHLELKSLPVWTQDRFWKTYYNQLRQLASVEEVEEQIRKMSMEQCRGSKSSKFKAVRKRLCHVQLDSLSPAFVEGVHALQGLEELKLTVSDDREDKDRPSVDAVLAGLIEAIDLTALHKLAISSTAERQVLTSACIQAFVKKLEALQAQDLEVTLRERNLTAGEEELLRSLEPQGRVKRMKVNGWVERPDPSRTNAKSKGTLFFDTYLMENVEKMDSDGFSFMGR